MKICHVKLNNFIKEVFLKNGCNEKEAQIIATNLVEADLRGIFSHGSSRVNRYIRHLRNEIIETNVNIEKIFETTFSAVIDGKNGIGQMIADYSMDLAIDKAIKNGIGLVSVKNSNHYGMAGLYAEKALERNLIGISMTNSAPIVVPTNGSKPLLGTNPISVSIPIRNKNSILIDMSTSVVTKGKLEFYNKINQKIPSNWVFDKENDINNPQEAIELIKEKKGGILPLGGSSEKFGGHKGYALVLLVEILTAGLSLGEFSFNTYNQKGKISHFFAAINLDFFGDKMKIIDHISNLVKHIKKSKSMNGSEIFIHGEKEYRIRNKFIKNGIIFPYEIIAELKLIAQENSFEFSLEK